MLTQTTNLTEPQPIVTRWSIASGKGNKMFTLWVERSQMGTVNCRGFYYTNYVRNLSMTFEEALVKASEYTGVPAEEIEIGQEEVEPMNYGEDVLRWGKYDNHRVSQLEDTKYLQWMAKGGNIKSDRDGQWYPSMLGEKEKFMYLAQDRLIALGAWVEYKGRKMDKARAERYQTKDAFMAAAIRGHVYPGGERCKNVVLRLVRQSSFEVDSFSGYGTSTFYVATFITEDNKLLAYKGSTNWWSTINKMVTSFTVKLGEYKGEHQTMITRPKVSGELPYAEGELNPYTL